MDANAPLDPVARRLDAERGLGWMSEAWTLFAARAGLWVLLAVVGLGIILLTGVVPLLGALLSPFVSALVAGGFMLVADKQRAGQSPEVSDFFDILSHRGFRPLMVLTLLYIALSFAAALLIIPLFAVTGGTATLFSAILGGQEAALAAGLGSMLLGLLVFLLVALPILAMYWLALPLVLFDAAEPWRAMKASLHATLINMIPLLVYGLLAFVAAIAAVITLGLGFVVVMPLLLISWYLGFREIFSAAPVATGIERL